MVTRAVIDDFLSQRNLAIVGVSRDTRQFANSAYRMLRERGYRVYPVNPNAGEIEGDRCYPALSAVPGKVDGVVVFLPPNVTESVIPEIAASGITKVWLQQGTDSEKALQLCKDHNLSVVHGECIMMFLESVGFIHRAHKWVKKVTHSLPE